MNEPTALLSRAIPEDVGVSSASLADFVNRFFALEWTHGLVVLRHGRIIAEAYRSPCSPADRHQLFSLSKSFTSTALGMALGEGLVKSLDTPLVSFFPEYDSPRVTARMRRVTLRHLLTMSMGRDSCGLWGSRYAAEHEAFAASPAASDMRAVAERFAFGDENFGNGDMWVKNLLEDELRDEPGTCFTYNSAATFLVSAVVQKVSGQRLTDFLRPRLFDPLGFSHDVVWDTTPDGIDRGGTGLNLTVREIAAAGQFWLRGGILPDGRRAIPADYFAASTSKQIDNAIPGGNADWSQGYGFQFWQCQHGAFRGDGASGQLAVMMPSQDAVVAATAGLNDMQRELNIIWEHLLPAFHEAPQPRDPEGVARLRNAENSQRFDLGPVGAPNPDFPMGEIRDFVADTNVYGIVGVTLEQDAGGITLGLAFGDGYTDNLNAGWNAPRLSLLGRIALQHSFEAHARASWASPTELRITVAMPRSTTFLNLSLDLARHNLHCHANIWFAHPWLADGDIPLSPRIAV